MSRKELLREYRSRRPPMGVYRVRNTVTGNAIVAAHRDLPSILNRHRAQLRMSAHASRRLQADWDEHGPDSFEFEILDTLPPVDDPTYDPVPDLAALEDLWLERIGTTAERLYTIDPRRLV